MEYYERINNRRPTKPIKTFKTETKKVVKALLITLSLMIVVLATAFLALVSSSSQKGYKLEQLKIQNEELKNQNTSLKAKITDASAFSTIKEEDKLSDMQENEQKTFVTEEDNRVN